MELPLSRGVVATIDDQDYEIVQGRRWHAFPARSSTGKFYARGTINGHAVLLHRFLMNAAPNETVDHINRDTLDNRRSNLRIATPAEQAQNRPPRTSHGFKGVTYEVPPPARIRNKPWRAGICKDGRQLFIGKFATGELAARAYDASAKELYGEHAFLNFPEGA